MDGAAATVRDAFGRPRIPEGGTVAVAEAEAAADAWSEEATGALLNIVALVPTGPLAMSQDFDDLVPTSTSLGEASTDGGRLTLHSLSRSSNDAASPSSSAALDAAARLGGGEARDEAQLRRLAARPRFGGTRGSQEQTYERLFGEEPIVTGVHAGLETAVIGEQGRRSGHDLVRPEIEAPRFPDERVSIPTVERFWKLLVGFRGRDVEPRGRGSQLQPLGSSYSSSWVRDRDDPGRFRGGRERRQHRRDGQRFRLGRRRVRFGRCLGRPARGTFGTAAGQSNYGAETGTAEHGDSVERTLVVSGAPSTARSRSPTTRWAKGCRGGRHPGRGPRRTGRSDTSRTGPSKTESDLRAAQQSLDDDADTTSGAFGALGQCDRGALQKSGGKRTLRPSSRFPSSIRELADALESSGNWARS